MSETHIYTAYDQETGRYRAAGPVAAGEAQVVTLPPAVSRPVAVALYPGAGGSAWVEATLAAPEELETGAARWIVWDAGAVGADTVATWTGPLTALRVRAEGAAAQWEVTL